jgi:transcriptional regulator GlxA family with amidase domain
MRWNGAAPPTTLVCGTFQFTVAAQSMLLTLLPSQLYFAAAATHTNGLQPLMAALVDEANAERQGKNTMLNRLADILFVQIIRAWLIDPHSTVKGWLAGLRDAQISQALSAFHALPEKNWTVAALAWQANMSRSAFAARFTDLMGIAPIQYVLSWRMQLAQRLLRQQELSLAQIALQIGYDSDTAFSKAFKREQGISPAAYRRAVRSQFD